PESHLDACPRRPRGRPPAAHEGLERTRVPAGCPPRQGSEPRSEEVEAELAGQRLAEPAGEGCPRALRGDAAEQRELGELRGKPRTPDGEGLSQVASMRECVRQHCFSAQRTI